MQLLQLLLAHVVALGVFSCDVYYVKSRDNLSSDCPDGEPCQTMDQYASQPSKYFTSGALFYFLAGNHSVHTTIQLKNISDLNFREKENKSDVAVMILCETKLAIHCESVRNITMQGITFVLHASGNKNEKSLVFGIYDGEVLFLDLNFLGSSHSVRTEFLSGAVYCNHSNVIFVSCLFRGNTLDYGGAIYASDGSNVTLNGNTFIENKALYCGGAIALNKSFLLLKESLGNIFAHNLAILYYGGAIFGQQSRLDIIELDDNSTDLLPNEDEVISNSDSAGQYCIKMKQSCDHKLSQPHASHFSCNKANYGGAIFLMETSVASLSGNVIFYNNSAALVSGAIFSTQSTITLNTKLSCFISNEAQLAGGAYFGNNSLLSLGMELDASFHYLVRNSAKYSGGAIHLAFGSLELKGSDMIFSHNYLKEASQDAFGGAIHVQNCSFTTSGRILFTHNYAGSGGAVSVLATAALFGGRVTDFINNSATVFGGGGIVARNSTIIIIAEVLNFVNNSAVAHDDTVQIGGGIQLFYSELCVKMQTTHFDFIGNYAGEGGAIYCFHSTYEVMMANFINNTATVPHFSSGGAIAAVYCNASHHDIDFTGNSGCAIVIYDSTAIFTGDVNFNRNNGQIGGAVVAYLSSIFFKDYTVIEENLAKTDGGAINALNTNLFFTGITSFTDNSALRNGGAVYGHRETRITMSGVVIFSSNSAVENGGAIFTSEGNLVITASDNVTLKFNRAKNGAALHFENGAKMTFKEHSYLTTMHNHATEYGGAIFHKDSITPLQCQFAVSKSTDIKVSTLPDCFLELEIEFRDGNIIIPSVISSSNDVADIDGSFLYGGLLDKCKVLTITNNMTIEFIMTTVLPTATDQKTFDLKLTSNATTNAISSEAYMLCFCENTQKLVCSEAINIQTYRGRKLTVSLLALSQGNTVTSTSLATKLNPTARLKLNQSLQILPKNCTNISYNLYSTEEVEELIVYPDNGSCRDTGLAMAVINVTLLPCPDGFTLSGDQCICVKRLQMYNAECVIFDDEVYVIRKAKQKFWVSSLYLNNTFQGVILYRTCPVECCKTETTVNISLSQPDIQCDSNHGGVLCGACVSNHSLMLGSSKCQVCSNTYLALLLPFASAGIALVVFLSFLRLTVATGMVNAIIFYANIVQANKKLLIPTSKNNILSVFIAWMNLDLGFETCFYNGMDAYAQTWLQFAFPVYVWVLITLIIVTSRYSTSMTKLIGSNPVAVLATLLLMSYAKLLKIIVEVYSSVKLDYPDNKTVTVWLKDANVPYLQSRHLLLTIVTTLVLVFFFLPYTFFLLLGYKLYRLSGRKYSHWLIRIKPLLDSYYAPYERNTRYWTGLLLLVRCALYIIFSFNSLGDSSKSLLAIIIVITTVMAIAWLSVKIYKSFCCNTIEVSIYFNLIVLSAAASNDANSPTMVSCFVGMVFITTVGIFTYHFYLLYIAKSAICLKLLSKLRMLKNQSEATTLLDPDNSSSGYYHCANVTKSVVSLREPLLDNT